MTKKKTLQRPKTGFWRGFEGKLDIFHYLMERPPVLGGFSSPSGFLAIAAEFSLGFEH